MSATLDDCVRAALERYFAELDGVPPQGVHAMVMRSVERAVLAAVIERTAGNQTQAAQLLGIQRATLRRKLIDYGLLLSVSEAAAGNHCMAATRRGAP